MKIISLLIAQIFLFTTLALPEQAGNFAHLRPKVGIDPKRIESMTSHMKRLGKVKETRMGILITQVLKELQPELEDKTKDIEETSIYGIKAKVLYIENIGITSEIAYRFLSSDNKIIIVINSSYPKNIQGEALYQMAREAFWADQGFSRDEAHVISSAELVQEFSKVKELIAYHRVVLEYMSEDGLRAIQGEDEKARVNHHKIRHNVLLVLLVFEITIPLKITNFMFLT